MKSHLYLLQLDLYITGYKFALLCFLTAFAFTLASIPVVIRLVKKYRLCDVPNGRKVHTTPIPTMGGVAIIGGMVAALALWFPFSSEVAQVSFFFSITILFGLGIMDDIRDLSAKYKFMIQFALAALIAVSGIRITSLEGLLGVHDLPLIAQYSFTILAIVGITNAFNLIDGIDGLAGGLGFMSLVTLGIFLTMSGDANTALIAFALAGGLLAFLYFNFNPAKIFMGDTGSLVLGFVVAVLCIRLMQVSNSVPNPVLPHAPIFVLGIVLIPVFDTLRVFATRTWYGKSPFIADKTHIHHLLTNQGFSHALASKVICFVHAFILMETYWLRTIRQDFALAILVIIMLIVTFSLRHLGTIWPRKVDLRRLKTKD